MGLTKKQKKKLLEETMSVIHRVKKGFVRFSKNQKKSRFWEELA